jgi:hypothetical protein
MMDLGKIKASCSLEVPGRLVLALAIVLATFLIRCFLSH